MTLNIVGIGGAPGSGKTALVTAILSRYTAHLFRFGLLRGHVTAPGTAGVSIAILGLYDGSTYAGTDRLSMAVMPDAISFLERARGLGIGAVLFEGDRLFSERFLTACERGGHTCTWLLLSAAADTLTARRAERPNTQNASWLKGRETKLERLAERHPVIRLNSDGPSDSDAARALILDRLNGVPMALPDA